MTWLPDRGWIREQYDYATWCTDAPGIFHVASALTTVAAAVGDSAELVIAGDVHPLNLWVMLAGASSLDRKTTATRLAIDRLRAVEPQRVLGLYGSPEGVFGEIAAHPCCVLYVPEGQSMFEQREASYWRHAKGLLMDLYDPVQVVRRQLAKQELTIENPRVSILAACATPLLERYTSVTDWLGGFLPRFLMVTGPRRAHQAHTRADERIAQRLDDDLYRLRQRPATTVRMSNAAQHAIDTFDRDLVKRIESYPIELHPALTRLTETATRVAALYELAARPHSTGPVLVSPASARCAVALCEASTETLRSLAGLATSSVAGRELLRLEETIREAGVEGISRSDLIRKMRVKRFELDQLIETLTQGEAILETTESTRGRPRVIYRHQVIQAVPVVQRPWISLRNPELTTLVGLAKHDDGDRN